MRKIKTRKRARIMNRIDRVLAVVFATFAILGGGWCFMVWYFVGTPFWLMMIGEAAAIGLFWLSVGFYEAVEIEASRFWDREEI